MTPKGGPERNAVGPESDRSRGLSEILESFAPKRPEWKAEIFPVEDRLDPGVAIILVGGALSLAALAYLLFRKNGGGRKDEL